MTNKFEENAGGGGVQAALSQNSFFFCFRNSALPSLFSETSTTAGRHYAPRRIEWMIPHMKTSYFQTLVAGVLILFAHLGSAQTAVIPPTISAQPTNQTVVHGANVTFMVTATGTDLTYQWRKNGKDFADYENVSGAGTHTLKLVGVAQIDAGDYSVLIRNASGAITTAVATLEIKPITVFSDDFEMGLTNWTAFSELPGLVEALHQSATAKKLNPTSKGSLSPEATRLTVSDEQNHSPKGSRSALLDSSQQKMYHNLGMELPARVRATFWIYDDGGSQSRWYGELRGYTGPGHGIYTFPAGMKQLFAIGRYGSSFGTNHTGQLVGEKADMKKYQAKVERGKNTGWFNLADAPDRSVGWHKFAIERDANGTTIHFYVDDVLGRTIEQADHVLLDCVTIGSIGTGTGVGNAWFDDVKVEAFPWRFDWQSKDSEGKGLFDWMKLRETGDDPVITDVRQINTVAQVDAADFQNSIGKWNTERSAIYAADMRGAMDYVFTVPAADAYRIEIEGRERRGKMPVVKLPLNVWIDGEYLGRFILPYDGKTNGFVHCFTPFITSGQHTVRVYWDNAENKCSLYLQAVRLQTLDGVDLNNNGFKDWAETRVLAQSGLNPVPHSSRASPVCIEGRGRYFSMIQCKAGGLLDEMQSVTVQSGAGDLWFADVPLSANGSTQIRVSHQNGILNESSEIEWEVTNLLEADNTVIRKGDALLLNAQPTKESSGAVNIAIAGIADYSTDAAKPVAHRFDKAGTFTVTGTFLPTGATRSITVKVVEASFGDSISAWVGKRRFWDMENIPPEVVIEADPRLKLTRVSKEERAQQIPTPPPLGINGHQYSVIADAAEPRVVVARLGANGPIIARSVVEGFRLFNWYDTYLRYVQIHDDGSQTIEEAMILSLMRPDIKVVVRIIVSGVTFDDGTLTKTLMADDFDTLGICRVRYIRADGVKNSVCHVTKVYQGDTLIGWPAYEK